VQITDASGRPTLGYLVDRWKRKPDCAKPIAIRRDSKWSFVTPEGRPLFDPPVFENVYAFDGEYAVVEQNGKWGLIDISGRFVQPVRFDAYKDKAGDVFQFFLDGREIWITASGEERPVPPATYAPNPASLACGHGLRLIERDGTWGIAEEDGREVIAPRYRALSCFREGVAFAAIDAQRAWCPLGPDGAARARPNCQAAFYPIEQSHTQPEKLHDDPFENSVLWTRAYFEFHAGKRAIPPGFVSHGVWDPRNVVIR
jgi:hypothetical protein